MNTSRPSKGRPRSVHLWISAAFIVFGVVMLVALSIQAYNSQLLLEHKSWTDILRSLSADYAGRVRSGQGPRFRARARSGPGTSRVGATRRGRRTFWSICRLDTIRPKATISMSLRRPAFMCWSKTCHRDGSSLRSISPRWSNNRTATPS
ncbi:hypothetical protein [Lysobacter gummosus]|uniref:hypothetical protein n=1 Tax=Lysobacter gummosus TaxID=262324 RepID=UPI00362821D7